MSISETYLKEEEVDAEKIYGELISFCIEEFVGIYKYKDLTAAISEEDKAAIIDIILATKLDIESGIRIGKRKTTLIMEKIRSIKVKEQLEAENEKIKLIRATERVLNNVRGHLITLRATVKNGAVKTYQDFRTFVHVFIDSLLEEIQRSAPIAAVRLQDLARS